MVESGADRRSISVVRVGRKRKDDPLPDEFVRGGVDLRLRGRHVATAGPSGWMSARLDPQCSALPVDHLGAHAPGPASRLEARDVAKEIVGAPG